MKLRDTSPGRLYALSSEIGCVAINGAMAVDIPAGGQVVVLALDKKIVIDGDDAAKFVEVRWGTNTVVGSRPAPAWLSDVLSGLISIVGDANFDINYIPAENKLYLQFSLEVTTAQIDEVQNLLENELLKDLVVEIDPFPVDCTKVEYLENTGTQWIDTGIVKHDDKYRARCEYAAPPAFISGNLFGCSYTHNGELFRNVFRFFNTLYFGRFAHYASGDYILPINYAETGYDGTARNVLESTSAANKVILNGEMVSLSALGGASNTTNPLNTPISLLKGSPGVKVFSFTIFNDSNLADIDLIPALDPTGTPCMFDTVTRTPFRNNGDGDFIIGIETQQQLDAVLSMLPNRTGQDVGTLAVRLADDLQTDENRAAMDAMVAKNWEITEAT